MFDKIIETLARWWAVNDEKNLPATVDLIVPVAHGATKDCPTNGALVVTYTTSALLKKYPQSTCRFGAFTGSENSQIEQTVFSTQV